MSTTVKIVLNGKTYLVMPRNSVCEEFPNGDRRYVGGKERAEVLAALKARQAK